MYLLGNSDIDLLKVNSERKFQSSISEEQINILSEETIYAVAV